MDEQRLSELFQAAAGDGPPASFDEADVAAAAKKVTARRRSMIAGGGGLAVVAIAVGLLLGTGTFGHTLPQGSATAAGALVSPRTETSGRTFGHALAGPDVGTPQSFPSSTPMQGGGGAGGVGPAAGSTRAGCGPTDGQLAVALANELPSVGAPTANPASVACAAGSRSVTFLVRDGVTSGYVIAVLSPTASNSLVSDAAPGAHSFQGPSASGKWMVFVLSQPANGGAGPLVGKLDTIQAAVAAQF
ncbi:MAG TPA: hypothetical protein VFX16_02515 [Pseudonocardiaceae bacterium]|nr:hypothetical protein [Pseudonocardiaceae bacterium]